MAGAVADQCTLAYRQETEYGTLAVGDYTLIRYTGENLKQDTSSTESHELRSDRQTTDMIRTGIRATGGFDYELSYAAFDDFFKYALMASAWSTPVTVTGSSDISFVVSGNTITSTDTTKFANLVQYQWIKISNTTYNNGYWKIATQSGDTLTVTGGTIVAEASTSATLYQGAYIEQGTTLNSISVEREHNEYSNVFEVITGLCVSGASMSVSPENIITGRFDFIGKREAGRTQTAGDGDNTAAATNSVMNAVDHVSAILENQTEYTATSFSWNLNNNLRERLVIGTLGAESIGKGKIKIDGTLQAHLDSITTMNKYRNWTTSNIAIVLVDGSSNGYVFDWPETKFHDGQQVAGGENTDIIADLSWSAFMDPSESKTFRIAKFPGS